MNARGDEMVCYTDFALQEYAMGRLDPGVRAELEQHLKICCNCANGARDLAEEATLLREALTSMEHPVALPEISDETLALYLCRALGSPEADRLEEQLGIDSDLLQRLVNMNSALIELQNDGFEERAAPLLPTPAGEILRMPRRIQAPLTVTLPRRAQGG